MALRSINVLMSCVVGSVYFCKIFFDFGVNSFVTNFFPTSTAAILPASKAFFAPSLATLLPTSRAEDAICSAALLVKILVYLKHLVFLIHTHQFVSNTCMTRFLASKQ